MRVIKLVLILALFFSFQVNGQNWLWGRQGTASSDTWGIAADDMGNGYLTGLFGDSISFGPYHLTSTSLGDADIVKYDSTGKVTWARQSKSWPRNNRAFANNVSADKSGNVYIVGGFNDTVCFGMDTLRTTPAGSMFLVKYDKNGNVLWARESITTGSTGTNYSIHVDINGSIYVTGIFSADILFGTFHLYASSAFELFIVKYDSSGNVIWANQSFTPKGVGNKVSWWISTDNYMNVYMTGNFSENISFGKDTLTNTTFWGEAFIVKYNKNGKVMWDRESYSRGANAETIGYAVVADGKGNSYMTGSFVDSVNFGKLILFDSCYYASEVFLVKFDSSGNPIWAKQSTYTNNGWAGYSLAVDGNDNIYIAGGTQWGYDSIVLCNDTLKINNASDAAFIMKLDTAGQAICSSIIRTGGDDNNTVACSYSGKYVYLGGDIGDTITFNKSFLFEDSANEEPPFIARWAACAQGPQSINNIIEPNQNITLFPNPNNGIFQLKINYYELGIKSTVEIYNVLGEKVYEETLRKAQGDNKIDISSQSAGLYLYGVLNEEGTLISSGKFVIQH